MKTFSMKGRTIKAREPSESENPNGYPLTVDIECLACNAPPGSPCTGLISASKHDDDPYHFTREWYASEIHRHLKDGAFIPSSEPHAKMYGAPLTHPRKP